jgi:hypothetical protein
MSQEIANIETRKCPYCTKKISVEAIVCRHCGRFILHPSTAKSLVEDLKTDPTLFLLIQIAEELQKQNSSSFSDQIQKEMIQQTKYLRACAGAAQFIGLLAFFFILYSLFFSSCSGFW